MDGIEKSVTARYEIDGGKGALRPESSAVLSWLLRGSSPIIVLEMQLGSDRETFRIDGLVAANAIKLTSGERVRHVGRG